MCAFSLRQIGHHGMSQQLELRGKAVGQHHRLNDTIYCANGACLASIAT